MANIYDNDNLDLFDDPNLATSDLFEEPEFSNEIDTTEYQYRPPSDEKSGFFHGFTDFSRGDIPLVGGFAEGAQYARIAYLASNVKTLDDDEKAELMEGLQDLEDQENADWSYTLGSGIKSSLVFATELGAAALLAAPTGGGSVAELLSGKTIAKIAKTKMKDLSIEAIKKYLKNASKKLVKGGTVDLFKNIGKQRAARRMQEVALTRKVGSVLRNKFGNNVVTKVLSRAPALAAVSLADNIATSDRMYSGTQRRKMNAVLSGRDPDSVDAFSNALLDNIIENLSERSGGALGKVVGHYTPSKVKDYIAKKTILKHFINIGDSKGSKLQRLFHAGGVHSVIEEMGEERLGGFLRGLIGVDGATSAVEEMIPSFEQLSLEIPMFAIPGAARSVMYSGYNKYKGSKYIKARLDNLEDKDPKSPEELFNLKDDDFLDILRRANNGDKEAEVALSMHDPKDIQSARFYLEKKALKGNSYKKAMKNLMLFNYTPEYRKFGKSSDKDVAEMQIQDAIIKDELEKSGTNMSTSDFHEIAAIDNFEERQEVLYRKLGIKNTKGVKAAEANAELLNFDEVLDAVNQKSMHPIAQSRSDMSMSNYDLFDQRKKDTLRGHNSDFSTLTDVTYNDFMAYQEEMLAEAIDKGESVQDHPALLPSVKQKHAYNTAAKELDKKTQEVIIDKELRERASKTDEAVEDIVAEEKVESKPVDKEESVVTNNKEVVVNDKDEEDKKADDKVVEDIVQEENTEKPTKSANTNLQKRQTIKPAIKFENEIEAILNDKKGDYPSKQAKINKAYDDLLENNDDKHGSFKKVRDKALKTIKDKSSKIGAKSIGKVKELHVNKKSKDVEPPVNTGDEKHEVITTKEGVDDKIVSMAMEYINKSGKMTPNDIIHAVGQDLTNDYKISVNDAKFDLSKRVEDMVKLLNDATVGRYLSSEKRKLAGIESNSDTLTGISKEADDVYNTYVADLSKEEYKALFNYFAKDYNSIDRRVDAVFAFGDVLFGSNYSKEALIDLAKRGDRGEIKAFILANAFNFRKSVHDVKKLTEGENTELSLLADRFKSTYSSVVALTAVEVKSIASVSTNVIEYTMDITDENLEASFAPGNRYIVFDIEATSLKPARGETYEVSFNIVDVDKDGKQTETKKTFSFDVKDFDEKTSGVELHKVNAAKRRNIENFDKRKDFVDFFKEVLNHDSAHLVGHNIKGYDLNFLQNDSKMIEAGILEAFNLIDERNIIDTYKDLFLSMKNANKDNFKSRSLSQGNIALDLANSLPAGHEAEVDKIIDLVTNKLHDSTADVEISKFIYKYYNSAVKFNITGQTRVNGHELLSRKNLSDPIDTLKEAVDNVNSASAAIPNSVKITKKEAEALSESEKYDNLHYLFNFYLGIEHNFGYEMIYDDLPAFAGAEESVYTWFEDNIATIKKSIDEKLGKYDSTYRNSNNDTVSTFMMRSEVINDETISKYNLIYIDVDNFSDYATVAHTTFGLWYNAFVNDADTYHQPLLPFGDKHSIFAAEVPLKAKSIEIDRNDKDFNIVPGYYRSAIAKTLGTKTNDPRVTAYFKAFESDLINSMQSNNDGNSIMDLVIDKDLMVANPALAITRGAHIASPGVSYNEDFIRKEFDIPDDQPVTYDSIEYVLDDDDIEALGGNAEEIFKEFDGARYLTPADMELLAKSRGAKYEPGDHIGSVKNIHTGTAVDGTHTHIEKCMDVNVNNNIELLRVKGKSKALDFYSKIAKLMNNNRKDNKRISMLTITVPGYGNSAIKVSDESISAVINNKEYEQDTIKTRTLYLKDLRFQEESEHTSEPNGRGIFTQFIANFLSDDGFKRFFEDILIDQNEELIKDPITAEEILNDKVFIRLMSNPALIKMSKDYDTYKDNVVLKDRMKTEILAAINSRILPKTLVSAHRTVPGAGMGLKPATVVNGKFVPGDVIMYAAENIRAEKTYKNMSAAKAARIKDTSPSFISVSPSGSVKSEQFTILIDNKPYNDNLLFSSKKEALKFVDDNSDEFEGKKVKTKKSYVDPTNVITGGTVYHVLVDGKRNKSLPFFGKKADAQAYIDDTLKNDRRFEGRNLDIQIQNKLGDKKIQSFSGLRKVNARGKNPVLIFSNANAQRRYVDNEIRISYDDISEKDYIKNSDGTVTIPGALCIVNRLPSSDWHQHNVARLKTNLRDTKLGNTSIIMMSANDDALAGGDKDGDSRYVMFGEIALKAFDAISRNAGRYFRETDDTALSKLFGVTEKDTEHNIVQVTSANDFANNHVMASLGKDMVGNVASAMSKYKLAASYIKGSEEPLDGVLEEVSYTLDTYLQIVIDNIKKYHITNYKLSPEYINIMLYAPMRKIDNEAEIHDKGGAEAVVHARIKEVFRILEESKKLRSEYELHYKNGMQPFTAITRIGNFDSDFVTLFHKAFDYINLSNMIYKPLTHKFTQPDEVAYILNNNYKKNLDKIKPGVFKEHIEAYYDSIREHLGDIPDLSYSGNFHDQGYYDKQHYFKDMRRSLLLATLGNMNKNRNYYSKLESVRKEIEKNSLFGNDGLLLHRYSGKRPSANESVAFHDEWDKLGDEARHYIFSQNMKMAIIKGQKFEGGVFSLIPPAYQMAFFKEFSKYGKNLSSGEINAADLLNALDLTDVDDNIRSLIEDIRSNFRSYPSVIINSEDETYYNTEADVTFLRERFTPKELVHELLHSTLYRTYMQDPHFRKTVNRFYMALTNQDIKKSVDAFDNADLDPEVVNEFMVDFLLGDLNTAELADAYEKFKEQKSKKGSLIARFFDQIVDYIKNFFSMNGYEAIEEFSVILRDEINRPTLKTYRQTAKSMLYRSKVTNLFSSDSLSDAEVVENYRELLALLAQAPEELANAAAEDIIKFDAVYDSFSVLVEPLLRLADTKYAKDVKHPLHFVSEEIYGVGVDAYKIISKNAKKLREKVLDGTVKNADIVKMKNPIHSNEYSSVKVAKGQTHLDPITNSERADILKHVESILKQLIDKFEGTRRDNVQKEIDREKESNKVEITKEEAYETVIGNEEDANNYIKKVIGAIPPNITNPVEYAERIKEKLQNGEKINTDSIRKSIEPFDDMNKVIDYGIARGVHEANKIAKEYGSRKALEEAYDELLSYRRGDKATEDYSKDIIELDKKLKAVVADLGLHDGFNYTLFPQNTGRERIIELIEMKTRKRINPKADRKKLKKAFELLFPEDDFNSIYDKTRDNLSTYISSFYKKAHLFSALYKLTNAMNKAKFASSSPRKGYTRIDNPFIFQVVPASPEDDFAFKNDDGKFMKRVPIYIHDKYAKEINRMFAPSKLKGVPLMKGIDDIVKLTKMLQIQFSFFHHAAFIRSAVLMGKGNNIKFHKRMKEGLAAFDEGMDLDSVDIDALDEDASAGHLLRVLIENGLTIFSTEEYSNYDEMETILGEFMRKGEITGKLADKMRNLSGEFSRLLFARLGAGLKYQVAVTELRHAIANMKQGEDINKLIKDVAASVNNDFGGINHRRESKIFGVVERTQTMQHIYRTIAFAPDWLESNFKILIDAAGSSDTNKRSLARAQLGRLMGRYALMYAVGNLAMSMISQGDPDKYDESFASKMLYRLNKGWNQGDLKWLDIDISPIFPTDKYESAYFNPVGHFQDYLKMIPDFSLTNPEAGLLDNAATFLSHKTSTPARMVVELITGKNTFGQAYSTTGQFLDTGFTALGNKKKEMISGKNRISQLLPILVDNVKSVLPFSAQTAYKLIKSKDGKTTAKLAANLATFNISTRTPGNLEAIDTIGLFGGVLNTVRDMLPGAAKPHNVTTVAKWNADPDMVLKNSAFILEMDKNAKQPKWVAERLTKQSVAGSHKIPRKKSFRDIYGAATNRDYKGVPGVDRGHAGASGNYNTKKAKDATFIMSNMMAQASGLNRGKWKDLEIWTRDLTEDGPVDVYTGPILDDWNLQRVNGLLIPRRFYKIIVQGNKAIGFILPNKKIKGSLKNYATTVDEVERLTGLDFITNTDESNLNLSDWQWTSRKFKRED